MDPNGVEIEAEVKVFIDSYGYLWVVSSDNLSTEETKHLLSQGLEAMNLEPEDPKFPYKRKVKHLFEVK